LHFRASKNIGVDPKEIAEVLMHVAVYAGVPAANRAFALAKSILAVPGDVSADGAADAPASE
jgi:alkylhydroperoxidase/carboxymuconolactone decarboxylase family protein YurZ